MGNQTVRGLPVGVRRAACFDRRCYLRNVTRLAFVNSLAVEFRKVLEAKIVIGYPGFVTVIPF